MLQQSSPFSEVSDFQIEHMGVVFHVIRNRWHADVPIIRQLLQTITVSIPDTFAKFVDIVNVLYLPPQVGSLNF
ncbi:hypothetical protein AO260_17420 [Pseudomonas sp. ABAC21]|nr:hypothetical protein AO260_17420 [Pseudomonas sp. ABAC21]